MDIDLFPFQKRFLKGALALGVRRAALSLPRGNGKSTLAAHILERCLTPGDDLFRGGAEFILLAQSLEGAKMVFRPLRAALEHDMDYRFSESTTRMGIVHRPTRTSLRVVSSKGKSAMGLGANNPLVVADEPGAWEVNGGELMHDALEGSLGKPDSEMRIIYIGTLAPEGVEGNWWHSLIRGGSTEDTFVMALSGDPEKWNSLAELKRVNPLKRKFADSWNELLSKRKAAMGDTREKATFLSYQMNTPSEDESIMVLEVDDFKRCLARPVGEKAGRPIVGIDLGSGRAWHAATALYQSGRVEAIAVAPGIPALAAQEKRDRVPAGVYQRLANSGALMVDEDKRVQSVELLWAAVLEKWGMPVLAIADRHRVNDLRDCIGNSVNLEARSTLWFEASADIRALRRQAKDGNLSIEESSRNLLAVSLSKSRVENDRSGNYRLRKADIRGNTSRDDMVAALLLACGAAERYPERAEDEYISAVA